MNALAQPKFDFGRPIVPLASGTFDLDEALHLHFPVAIGVSGGKDSQAAAIATVDYLKLAGHRGPVVLIHSDLGVVEWDDSLPTCRDLAKYLGLELIVVRRKAGDLMERWEARWASSVARYESLSTVTLVLPWSTPGMRFCTSELKTHIIQAELKRRFPGQIVINVTGVRAEESSVRARKAVVEIKEGFIDWRPILKFTTDEVFAQIDATGLSPHPAYREFGMSRVSCRFCIMSNSADLAAAAAQAESHDLYRRMVDLEIASSFAFQGAKWLGDVAPRLLTGAQAERFRHAKTAAQLRKDAEAKITKEMLYVAGWPTRMLTDAEADILVTARRQVNNIMGFRSACLDRTSVHQRYAELIALRERRAA